VRGNASIASQKEVSTRSSRAQRTHGLLSSGGDRSRLEEDTMRKGTICTAVAVMVGFFGSAAGAQEAPAATCKEVHADLVEVQSTTECKPGHPVCFLGEVDGNHGLRGMTYFRGEQGALFPSTAPTFRSYVGSFEYTTASGTLTMREMGLTEPFTASNPESGVVNAFQRIVSGTGEFEGATGYLFVSGFNRNQRVVTTVHGELCVPKAAQ
jgi:hypothetical protein